MKSEDAQRLLENPAYVMAWDEVESYYIDRIKQNPLEDVEATIALSVIDRVKSAVESAAMDMRIEEHNKDLAKRYQ